MDVAEKVRVTEAKAQLSALMARVGYGEERFVIERRGRPLAALVSVEDLARLEGVDGVSRRLGAASQTPAILEAGIVPESSPEVPGLGVGRRRLWSAAQYPGPRALLLRVLEQGLEVS